MLQQLILFLGHGTVKAHCAIEEPWGELGCGDSCPHFAVCSSFLNNPVAERRVCLADCRVKV